MDLPFVLFWSYLPCTSLAPILIPEACEGHLLCPLLLHTHKCHLQERHWYLLGREGMEMYLPIKSYSFFIF